MTLHNYRSKQVHETLNGVNPSSSFKDMHSAVWTQIVAKFLAHGQAHMGQMGKWLWQCTTTGLDNSIKLWMEKIRQAATEIWVPQSGSRPPDSPPGPWRQYPSSTDGWGVKSYFLYLNIKKASLTWQCHAKWSTALQIWHLLILQITYASMLNLC